MTLQKRNIWAIVSTLVVLFIAFAIFQTYKKENTNEVVTPTPTASTQIEYKNTTYGFAFMLPKSWKGYTVIDDAWTGTNLNVEPVQTVSGPKISIRHPLWIAETPRQDIPILVFTPAQWDLIVSEKMGIGAAPIGPSELGRNASYVFALPARYNFAFPLGFEEVETILKSKPLKGF